MRSRRPWALAADVVVLAPLVVAVISGVSSGDPAWVNVSAGLGLLATSLLAVVVVLVCRVRGLSRAVGLELTQGMHRRLGVAVVGLAVLHTVVAISTSPNGWGKLDLRAAPPPVWAGVGAMVLMLTVAVTFPRSGVRRYALRVRVHAGLAGLTLLLIAVHVVVLRRLVSDPLAAVVLGAVALLVVALAFVRWVGRPLLDRGAHVVEAVRAENPMTTTLVLAPVHLRHRMHFEPGQYVWLRLHRGMVLTDEHPFTIAAGSRSGRLELTVRTGGDFTNTLRHLHRGRRVWLDGPFGSFTPSITPVDDVEVPAGLVFVAGGVGITPMMSILRALAAANDPRPHWLLLAERPGERLFTEELGALERRLRLAVIRTGGRRIDVDLVEGVLPVAAPARHEYFVAGSDALIRASLLALADCGVPGERIVTERFT